MPLSNVQRRAIFLLGCAGMYGIGRWHESLLHPPAPSHTANAQRLPASDHPPGYLSSKVQPNATATGAEALVRLLEKRAAPEDLAAALAAWAERDPEAAFRALLADPRLQRPETARALFKILGKNDPAQALQRLAQLPAVPWARDANKGLATGWTQRDPQAATTAGLALPPGTRRNDFLAATFGQWIKQDIISAHDWVLTLQPEEALDGLLTEEALRGAEIRSPQDMTALLDFPSIHMEAFPHLDPFGDGKPDPFQSWAAKSPEDALQWALALPQEREDKNNFLSAALQPLASDPARVLALLAQLKDPGVRESLVDSAAHAWAQRDPAAGWAWSAQLTDPSLRQLFETRLGSQWATLDPDTAIPWLSKVHSNQLATIDSEVMQKWSGANPDTALAMLGQLSKLDFGESIAEDLMEGLAMTQPALALDHLDLLQEIKQRNSVIGTAMSTWSQKDIAAASGYTDALPPGEDRQAAIGGILAAAFAESPESAFTWATTLTDPADRAVKIYTLLKHWRQKDPVAAQNWLDHAPLEIIQSQQEIEKARNQTIVD